MCIEARVLVSRVCLISYLFSVVMDEVTKEIQSEIPWCIMFADDIVLVGKNLKEVNNRLDEWRLALEEKGLRISKSKQSIKSMILEEETKREVDRTRRAMTMSDDVIGEV